MEDTTVNLYSQNVFDDSLLDLYDEQFKFNSFKSLIDVKNEKSNRIINRLLNQFENSEDSETCLVVDLSDEMKEKYKHGLIQFDKDKNGNMYAQLRKSDGKYGKKLNIKEEDVQTDLVFASQLNTIKDVLIEIVDVLESIENGINDILSGLHNDRIGLYYSGISIYLEAMHTEDSDLRKLLVAQSLKSLNDAQAQIVQEFKSDILYLMSAEYQKIKKKKHEQLVEKMNNIHECFQTINRIVSLKALIYFDENQFSSLMMVCTEYQRFIDTIVKPNSSFLIECDPRDDKLINSIWSKRASTFINCKEIQDKLKNRNEFYICLEEK